MKPKATIGYVKEPWKKLWLKLRYPDFFKDEKRISYTIKYGRKLYWLCRAQTSVGKKCGKCDYIIEQNNAIFRPQWLETRDPKYGRYVFCLRCFDPKKIKAEGEKKLNKL